MQDGRHDAVAVDVDEAERTRLVGDRQGELVVVDQADLLDLRGVVHVVQQHRVGEHLVLLGGGHLDGVRAHLDTRGDMVQLIPVCTDL